MMLQAWPKQSMSIIIINIIVYIVSPSNRSSKGGVVLLLSKSQKSAFSRNNYRPDYIDQEK